MSQTRREDTRRLVFLASQFFDTLCRGNHICSWRNLPLPLEFIRIATSAFLSSIAGVGTALSWEGTGAERVFAGEEELYWLQGLSGGWKDNVLGGVRGGKGMLCFKGFNHFVAQLELLTKFQSFHLLGRACP